MLPRLSGLESAILVHWLWNTVLTNDIRTSSPSRGILARGYRWPRHPPLARRPQEHARYQTSLLAQLASQKCRWQDHFELPGYVSCIKMTQSKSSAVTFIVYGAIASVSFGPGFEQELFGADRPRSLVFLLAVLRTQFWIQIPRATGAFPPSPSVTA